MNKLADTGWVSIPRNMRLMILALAALAVLLASAALLPAADSDSLEGTSILNEHGRIDHAFVERNNLDHGTEGEIFWAIYDESLYVDGKEGYEFAKISDYYGHSCLTHDRPNWEFADSYSTVKNAVLTKAITYIGSYAFCGPGTYWDSSHFDGYIGYSIDFSRCTYLTEIGESAFSHAMIANYEFPASLTTVRARAFEYSNPFFYNFFGQNVTVVEEDAFCYTRALLSPNKCMDAIVPHENSYSNDGIEGDVRYYFDFDGLHIEPAGSGPAEMKDYAFNVYPPWFEFHWYRNFNLIIEDGVTKIGNYAFHRYNDGTSWDGDHVFENVKISDSVEEIGACAFFSAEMNSIDIPSSVKVIGDSAFELCIFYSSQISLTGDVTIGEKAFSNSRLGSIDMSESSSLTIGKRAFYESWALQHITLPKHLCEIGEGAFYGCSLLKSLQLPESLVVIGDSAFECSTLQSIELPESLSRIGNKAFGACPLKSLVFMGTPSSIGTEAFMGCKNLEMILYNGDEPIQYIGDSAFCLNTDPDSTLDCNVFSKDNLADGIFDDYKGDNLNSTVFHYSDCADGNIGFTFENSTLHLFKSKTATDGTMRNYSADYRPLWERLGLLKYTDNVIIGSDITSIGNYAFYQKSGIRSISHENGSELRSIGDNAFAYCNANIIGFNLSNCSKLESIGNCAFLQCKGVIEFRIPGSVKDIGIQAFAGCSDLRSIYFEGDQWNISNIGEMAFSLYNGYSSCLIYSVDNCAAKKLDGYGGLYTYFNYAALKDNGDSPFDGADVSDGSGDSDALIKGVSAIVVFAITAVFIAFVERKY